MYNDEIEHIQTRLGLKIVAEDYSRIISHIIKHGYNDKAGARPMRDATHNLLSDAVLLCRRNGSGSTMRLHFGGRELMASWVESGEITDTKVT